jgi:hypothetical protein
MPFSPSRRFVVKGLFAALAFSGLAACAATPPPPSYPDIRFGGADSLPILALRVDTSSSYVPSFSPPNVEHLMPVSPEKMARQWALDRLQPVRNGRAVAHFTILDARVIETKLKVKDGIRGAFTDEPAERYDATLRVRFSLNDPERGYNGNVEAAVNQSLTVQKDASLNDREKAWYELVQKLSETFDRTMSANIRQYMPEALAR